MIKQTEASNELRETRSILERPLKAVRDRELTGTRGIGIDKFQLSIVRVKGGKTAKLTN